MKHHNVSIMLYEPKKAREKDARSIWRLVYGKSMVRFNTKKNCPQKTWDYWKAIVFTLKSSMYYESDGNVKVVGRYLREART